ncbi:MAG: hypothetical protein ACTSXZ_11590, partial [Alphaproteobacteria bacterium]
MPSSLGETTSVYIPPLRIRTDSVAESAGGENTGSGLWDKGGFGFSDFLDVINPLQHIPIVSTLYRSITGDDIGQVPRVIGGALFGGVIGFVASLLNAIVDEETGKDVGEHAIAMLFGGGEADSAPGGSPGGTTVATVSAFSPANDAIFPDVAAPAPPAPDRQPIMLAAAAPVVAPVVAPAAAPVSSATDASAAARAPAAVPPAASLAARSLAARP